MKSFIFTFAMVSCFLLSHSQDLSLESRTPTLTTKLVTTTFISETSSAAPAPAVLEALHHPLAKAVSAAPTITPTTKTPGPGQQQCKEIGSACSVSDECCSHRCTSYRRRCAY